MAVTPPVQVPYDGPAITTAADRRVARVGRFLRRTKLDELPELWNVLVVDHATCPEDPAWWRSRGPSSGWFGRVRGHDGPSQLAFFDEERLLTCSQPEEVYVRDIFASGAGARP
jgi:Bacterial sugar transferase